MRILRSTKISYPDCERLTVQQLLEGGEEDWNDEQVEDATQEESEGPYDSLELLGDAVTQEPSNEHKDYKIITKQ